MKKMVLIAATSFLLIASLSATIVNIYNDSDNDIIATANWVLCAPSDKAVPAGKADTLRAPCILDKITVKSTSGSAKDRAPIERKPATALGDKGFGIRKAADGSLTISENV